MTLFVSVMPCLAIAAQHVAGTPVDAVSGASVVTGNQDVAITFESAGMQLELEEILRTGEVIWAMDFIDPNTLIFTERTGQLKLLDLKSKSVTLISGSPEVMQTPSGGLFDVLVDPDFSSNRQVYFTYVKAVAQGSAIALASGRLEGSEIVDLADLFVANNGSDDHAHWGSRVAMDEQRYLYMTVGERHVPDNAQNLGSHSGKVLRFNADGSVPDDNPFVDHENALPEIWTLGHRNPQGLLVHPQDGQLYEQEHGPTGGDEINVLEPGLNYGWPVITWGENIWGGQKALGTTRPGMEQPLHYFLSNIAPSGMTFYFGERLPGWQGNLLSSTLRGYLHRLVFKDGQVEEERLLEDWRERMRDVVVGPDGLVYLATESGAIARLVPVP